MDQSQWSSYWRSYLSAQDDVIEEEDAQMPMPMHPHYFETGLWCRNSESTPSSSSVPGLSWSSNSSVFSRGMRSTSESTGEYYAQSSQRPSCGDHQTLESTSPASHASNLAPHESYPAPRRLIGIPPADLGTLGMTMQSLGLRLQTLGGNLQSFSLMPDYQLLVGLQKDLQELASHVDDLIQQTSPVPPQPAELPARNWPRKRPKDVYKCHFCQKDGKTFSSSVRAAFKRHLQIIHFPNEDYYCHEEGCDRVFRRRDKWMGHCRFVHHRVPQEKEVFAVRVPRSCPSFCVLCSCTISDWTEFYTCLAKHCLIRPGHSGHAGEPGSGNHNPSRSGLLQVDKPPEEPSQTQTTGVANASAMEDSHETSATADSPSAVVRPANSGRMEPGMHTLRIDEDLPDFRPLGLWYGPSSWITLPEGNIQSQPALFEPSTTTESDKKPISSTLQPVDSNTNKSSQPSDDDESRSMQTNITRPDLEDVFDIDDGIADSEDMEHILNPGAYYRKLDLLEQRTAELCGISSSNLQNACLSDCKDALENSIKALENLQKEGFCENAYTILVEDPHRPYIASTARITQHALNEVLNRISITFSDNAAFSPDVPTWPLLRTLLGSPSYELSSWETLDYLQFLANALTVGLVSFSGSHVCRFDKNLWGEEKNSIPIGNGYAFALQELACLKHFVGGPAWILGKDHESSQAHGLKISLTVKDLQELWGPIWFMEGGNDAGAFLRTEAGYIIPLPRDKQRYSPLAEIECHWSSSYTGHETDDPIMLTSSSRILIGTEPSIAPCFIVNEECPAQIAAIQARIRPQLQPAGAHNAHCTLESWNVRMQANVGSYVQAGGELKWKRTPARTWKTSIIDRCKYGKPKLMPLLASNIGLEVSACTGNARRVRLWDALRLSQTVAPRYAGDSVQQEDLPPCPHQIADPQCIESCWTRLSSTNDIDSFLDPPPEDPKSNKVQLRRVILDAIIALENTGVDYEDNLQVYWPFTENPWTHRINLASPSGGTNNWIRVIKDSRDVATFAVASQRCIEARHEHARTCATPGQMEIEISNRQKTTLYTRILVNPPIELNCTENHGCHVNGWPMKNVLDRINPHEHFALGEAALTVRRIIPSDDDIVIIATASGSAIKSGWMKSAKVEKRRMFQEDLDCDLSTGYNNLPLLVY